jgi:hypothetical protein
LLAKLAKNILKGVNFTNLKTLSGYIAKSKPQGVCLQLSQTPGDDYAIWPKINKDVETYIDKAVMEVVRGQNSSSHLFLGLEPHVRALAWLGVKWENDIRFTVVRPMGPTST